MPAKKNVKSKSAPKAKARAKAPVKKAAAKPAKKRHLKLVEKPAAPKSKSSMKKKTASPPQAPNFFRQLLEARKQEREARLAADQKHHDSRDPRQLLNDKHARFGRYAGPRRRAA